VVTEDKEGLKRGGRIYRGGILPYRRGRYGNARYEGMRSAWEISAIQRSIPTGIALLRRSAICSTHRPLYL